MKPITHAKEQGNHPEYAQARDPRTRIRNGDERTPVNDSFGLAPIMVPLSDWIEFDRLIRDKVKHSDARAPASIAAESSGQKAFQHAALVDAGRFDNRSDVAAFSLAKSVLAHSLTGECRFTVELVQLGVIAVTSRLEAATWHISLMARNRMATNRLSQLKHPISDALRHELGAPVLLTIEEANHEESW